MPKHLDRETVADRLCTFGYTLLSHEYVSSTHILKMRCNKCQGIYNKSYADVYKGCRHCPQFNRNTWRGKPLIDRNRCCPICNASFIAAKGNSKQTYCSRECVNESFRSQERRAKAKLNGSKGGKLSAASQQRRSKNEIYFAKLCKDHFGDELISTNEPMFDGWDADVIVKNKKVAIMWNGVWHYKQVNKNHSLKQVQARDKVKEAIISKHKYRCYTIKDMGKYDKGFVEYQFQVFLFMSITV